MYQNCCILMVHHYITFQTLHWFVWFHIWPLVVLNIQNPSVALIYNSIDIYSRIIPFVSMWLRVSMSFLTWAEYKILCYLLHKQDVASSGYNYLKQNIYTLAFPTGGGNLWFTMDSLTIHPWWCYTTLRAERRRDKNYIIFR